MMDVMEELQLNGYAAASCEHPPSARSAKSRGAFAVYTCDVEKGGCGVELGPVGGGRRGR